MPACGAKSKRKCCCAAPASTKLALKSSNTDLESRYRLRQLLVEAVDTVPKKPRVAIGAASAKL